MMHHLKQQRLKLPDLKVVVTAFAKWRSSTTVCTACFSLLKSYKIVVHKYHTDMIQIVSYSSSQLIASVSLFSKVLSAIFWMILVIFRGLLIPMRCVADLHFCLASGVLGGGVFTAKYHGWYAVCIRTFHILFQMFGFFYIFLSRSKISSHWHCKRRERHKVEL